MIIYYLPPTGTISAHIQSYIFIPGIRVLSSRLIPRRIPSNKECIQTRLMYLSINLQPRPSAPPRSFFFLFGKKRRTTFASSFYLLNAAPLNILPFAAYGQLLYMWWYNTLQHLPQPHRQGFTAHNTDHQPGYPLLLSSGIWNNCFIWMNLHPEMTRVSTIGRTLRGPQRIKLQLHR